MKKRFCDIKLVPVTQTSANDTPQHIGTIFVAGQHPVGDQESATANVIRNHPQGCRLQNFGLINNTRMLTGLLHQSGEQIDFIVAVHALENGGHTL